MKINFPFFKNTEKVNNKKPVKPVKPAAKIAKQEPDTFEREQKYFYAGTVLLNGQNEKDIVLKNGEGEEVQGAIVRRYDENSEFYLVAGDKAVSEFDACALGNELYITFDYILPEGYDYVSPYKETIKAAILISKKYGLNGRLRYMLQGRGLIDAFQNNFRAEREDNPIASNALIDYAQRNNRPDMLEKKLCPFFVLDEEGGKALMEGNHYYMNSQSATMYRTKHNENGVTFDCDVDFCDLDDKFAVQIITDYRRETRQAALLEGKITDGKLIAEKFYTSNIIKDKEFLKNEIDKGLEKAQALYTEAQATK